MKNKKNILIFGPQGSGKGTQAKLLAEALKIPQLSIGDLYRSEIKRNTAIGQQAEAYVARGALVPLSITATLLHKELKQSKYNRGLILDGFPRNLEQARFSRKLIKPDYLVVMDIPAEETIKRLSARRICNRCGQNFNVFISQSVDNKKCHCGGLLIRRKDDYPKAIKERLNIYNQQTVPIIKYYQPDSKIIRVNGQGTVADVFYRIVEGFKQYNIVI